MDTPPSLPSGQPKSGLAVASLVLGILGLTCCWFLASIPAVICGHIALAKIKASQDALSGKGMAIAGLVMGYLVIVGTFVLAPLSVPAVTNALEAGQSLGALVYGQQIATGLEAAHKEGVATGNSKLGYPADAGITSAEELVRMLVDAKIVTAEEVSKWPMQWMEVGNVSAEDPAETIVVRFDRREGKGYRTVVLKNGDSRLLKPGEDVSYGELPPRTPAFLQKNPL